MQLDNTGRPSILLKEAPSYNLAISTRQNGGAWTNQTVAPAPVASEMVLAYDSLNRPHIAYVDTAAKELRYASYDGVSWSSVKVAGGNEFLVDNPGFVFDLDSADRAHFIWSTTADTLAYAKPDGATWQVTGISGPTSAFPYDMQVDAAGRVHLAYNMFTGNVHTGGLFYGLFDGSSWATQRINGLNDFGEGRTQLAVDAQNNPHLFTLDGTFAGPDLLRHVYWSNSIWTNEPITQWTNTISGPEAISVELASDGYHVLYSTDAKNVYHAFLAVPEPSSCLLAAAGAAMTLAWGHRRRVARAVRREPSSLAQQ